MATLPLSTPVASHMPLTGKSLKLELKESSNMKETTYVFTTVSRNLMSNGCLAWSEEIDHNMVRVRDMLPETGWMVSQ